MDFQSKKQALFAFFKAMETLREEGILTNKKDFTCQIGEWLIETIYEGKRAISGIQKGWDVDVDGRHIQVKTHAKAEGNNNRWTHVDKDSTEEINELIILVFTHNYKLKEFYKAPWQSVLPHIRSRGKKTPRNEINWSSIKDFKTELEHLPHQDIISMFM